MRPNIATLPEPPAAAHYLNPTAQPWDTGAFAKGQIEGQVSAEELTVGGYVKGTLHANRVTANSTAVVKGDIFYRTLMIEGSDASMKSARAFVRWNR